MAGDEEIRQLIRREIQYEPLPTQRLFHLSDARFKGFSGPVGSGKSQALCQEAIRMSYLNPGRTGLIGAPTFPMLRDSTQAGLLALLEENKIPFDINKAENHLTLLDTGSKILFRSLDDSERLRGTNLAWFCVDELTYASEESWLRLEARLRDPKATRLGGFAVWTPRGFDWVYRRFMSGEYPGYETFVARAFENKYLLEQVPDYYDRLRASYDSRFYAQEVLGEYLNVQAGRVYGGFERSRNVVPGRKEFLAPLLWALDFNVDPMSSIVAQQFGDRVHVLDEIVLRRATTLQACEEFVERYPDHPGGLIIYGDASGQRMQTTGHSDFQMVREYLRSVRYGNVRMDVLRANPNVRDRVTLVNGQLCNADGVAKLLIDPRCRELIQDFEQVCFKPDSTVIDKEADPRRTHLSDALGYLVWQRCRPQSPFGFQGQRLF
jgi:phage terminase large subunit